MEVSHLIFGKHINKYYLKYGHMLLIGLVALVAVDYLQLVIPNLYQMVINGINDGIVMIDGVEHVFDFDFLLERICLPMIGVIMAMVVGRFLWRVMFFGAGIKVEEELRNNMFDKELLERLGSIVITESMRVSYTDGKKML